MVVSSNPDLYHALHPLLKLSSHWTVGFSGGVDSLVLLCALHEMGAPVTAVHVHHGLLPQADEWVQSIQELCATLEVPLMIRYVQVGMTGKGVEAAARQARYQAFSEIAKTQGYRHWVTAHHQQDQAETLLYRLLRGAGVQGMQGMLAQQHYPEWTLYRPLLNLSKAVINRVAQQYQQLYQWTPIQDPSNHDCRYARGALRHAVIPVLQQYWPHWQHNLSRHAQLMQEQQELLSEMAYLDYQYCQGQPQSIDLGLFRQLSAARQANLLRWMIHQTHAKMPTQKRLQDWLRQLNQVHQMGTDRQLTLRQEDLLIQLHQGRMVLLPLSQILQ